MTLAYLKLFADQAEELALLDDASRGRFVMGLMLYATQWIVPEFSGPEKLLWPSFRRSIDAAAAQVEAGIINGSKGGRPKKKPNENPQETENNPIQVQVQVQEQVHVQSLSKEREGAKAPKAPARTRFAPPTAEEVRAYAQDKGLQMDAEAFVDFYASKGWKVGNAPMKDWQAAVRNWAKRDRASPSQPKGPKVVREQQYEQRTYENSPDIPDWMMDRWKQMQKPPKMVREQMYSQREYTNSEPGLEPWMEEIRKELYGEEKACETS